MRVFLFCVCRQYKMKAVSVITQFNVKDEVKDVSKWSITAPSVTVRAAASFFLVIPAPV